MRKAILILLTAGICLGFSGCKKDKVNMLEFEMPYIDYVTVPETPGSTYLLPVTIYSKDAPTNSASEFSQKNTSPEKVKEIKLTRFQLTIVSPVDKNFQFLDWVKISLMSDGLPLTEVANKYNIDSTMGNVINLDIVGQDLKDYVKQPYFKMKAEIKAKSPVTQNLEIKSDIRFNVIAEAL